MSIIPDCRNDEAYNEKYLNEKDSEFVTGYDYCVSQGIENFFSNCLDIIMDDIAEFIEPDENGEIGISEEIVNGGKTLDEYSDEELSEMGPLNILLVALRQEMLMGAEIDRDELITSMLEGMVEAEYKNNKKKADAGTYKNAIVRQEEYEQDYAEGKIPTCWEYKKNEEGKTVRIGHCPNGNTIVEEVEL